MSNLTTYQGELKIDRGKVIYLDPVTRQQKPIQNDTADRLIAALQAVAKGDHSQAALVQQLHQQCLASAQLANKALDYQQELLLEQQRTNRTLANALADQQRQPSRVVRETRYVEHYYDGTVAAMLVAFLGTMGIVAMACLITMMSQSVRPAQSALPQQEVRAIG